MSTANMIALILHGQYDEAVSGEAGIKPGMLCRIAGGSRELYKANVAGGKGPLLVAIEDRLTGTPNKGIFDAYGDDEIVPFVRPVVGDVLNLLVTAAAPAIAKDDFLISKGDGTVIKIVSTGGEDLYVSSGPSTSIVAAVTTIEPYDKTYSFPANSLKVGDVIKVHAVCKAVQATNSSNTLTFTLKLGSVTIIATAAVDAGAGDVAVIDAMIVVTAIGASGSITASGTISFGASGTATQSPFYTAAQTIDTTAANVLTLNQTASAANAANEGRLEMLTVARDGLNEQAILLQAEEDLDLSEEEDDARIAARVITA